MSNVVIVGTLGGDPELRFTPTGKAVANFSIAENRGKDDQQSTHWFDVVCWNSLAENVSESLSKGMRVIVNGILEQQKWETDSGDKRSKIQVVAWQIGPSLEYATAQVTKNERGEQ
jgi:single-strand DNA-binding protein